MFMNRDFAIVRDALRALGSIARGFTQEADKRKELEVQEEQSIEALARLAKEPTVERAPIQGTPAKLFWDANGWYYRNLTNGRRTGPFDKIHETWKSADNNGYEIVDFQRTRG